MANFCPQCGGKIEPGQMKCSFCGKDLSSFENPYASQGINTQASGQSNISNSYGGQSDTSNSYGGHSDIGNSYGSGQNATNQYSTQGTDNQYGQNATNQYTGQNSVNQYTNYQDYTSNYNYQSAMPPTVPQSQGPNGLQIAGLVLGIISIVGCCCYGVTGLFFGIAGLVCSIMGNKENQHGMGMAGLICSIVGLVFSVITILFLIFMALVGESFDYLLY